MCSQLQNLSLLLLLYFFSIYLVDLAFFYLQTCKRQSDIENLAHFEKNSFD